MITIKRGNTELKVSEGSYKLYFEKMGFKKVKPVEEKKEEIVKPVETKKEETVVDNKEVASKKSNNKKAGDK